MIKTNKKPFFRIFTALFLTMVLIFNLSAAMPFSVQAAVDETFDDTVDVDDILLLRGGSEIKSGDSVLLGDILTLHYDFVMNAEQARLIYRDLGKAYTIPLPDGLVWSVDGFVADLFINYTEKFASVSVKDGVASITFEGYFWDSVYIDGDDIEEGELIITCKLDSDKVGSAYVFELNIGLNKTITLYVVNNKPASLFLGKTGVYADNQFTWQIVYDKGDSTPATPVTFVDTFNHTNHILIYDSLPAGATVDVGENITTITYESYDAALTWSYKTRLSDGALGDTAPGGNVTIVNSVEVFEEDNPAALASTTASVAVSAEQRRWMGKIGRQIGDGRIMEWEITINTLDRYLTELVLYDRLPAGLTLIPEEVRVNGVKIDSMSNPSGIWLDNTAGIQKDDKDEPILDTDYSFRVVFPVGGGYPQIYTVTYQTEIDASYFDDPSPNPVPFDNHAWLSFNWYRWYPSGPGPGTPWPPFVPPTIAKPGDVITNVLKKSALEYNPATGIIKWRVDVNPYGVNLLSGTITDDLTEFGQTYAGNFWSSDPRITLTEPVVDDELIIDVGALGRDKAYFTFEAFVGDLFFTSNKSQFFHNTAEFDGELNSGAVIKDTASAQVWAASRMLSKSAEDFKYDAGELIISWELIVNRNKMDLGDDPQIIDTLPAGLTFIPTSLTGAAGGSQALQVLTIDLHQNNETQTITYQTRVDPNNAELAGLFKSQNFVDITNEAKLIHGTGTYDEPEVSATQRVANQRLDKSFKAGDGNVDGNQRGEYYYTVNINPNGVILNPETDNDPDPPTGGTPETREVLIDTLPAGLRLDIESVKLERAIIEDNRTFTGTGEAWGYNDEDEDIKIFDFSGYPANFKITLPSDDARDRYILTYICVVAPGNHNILSNKIEYASGGGAGDGNDASNLNLAGGGGGTSTRLANVSLTLQDSMRSGVKIDGVTFEVSRRIGDADVVEMVVTTNASGVAQLYPLVEGATYTIKQTGAKAGYPASTLTVLVGSANNVSFTDPPGNTMTLTVTNRTAPSIVVTNTPAVGNIVFNKRSDITEKGVFEDIVDATFTITDQTTGSTYVPTLTSADGTVTFTGVPFGRYRVTETNVPQYHTGAPAFFVRIDATGVFTEDGGTVISGARVVNNVFFRPSVEITKSGLGSADSVTFTLFDTTGGGKVQAGSPQTRTGNGTVTFADLRGGHSYVIEESNANANYYRTGTLTIPASGVVNQTANFTANWTNYPHSASLTVTVQDSRYTDVMVGGAAFTLYSDAGLLNAVGTGTTDASGKLVFTNLPMTQNTPYTINSPPSVSNTNYWLVPTAVPSGYVLDSTAIPVTLTGIYTDNTDKTVILSPAAAATLNLSFTKTSSDGGLPLAGAEFTLSLDNSGFEMTATSGANGNVSFANVPFGTYTLTETYAPSPHLPVAPVAVVINSSGELTTFGTHNVNNPLVVENEVSNSNVIITKLDVSDDSLMEGVTFMLQREISAGTWTTEQTKVTGADGKMAFTALFPGREYRIVEVTPSGYFASTEPWVFTAVNDTTELTWYNHPLQIGSITITKSETSTAPGRDIPIEGAVFVLYRNGTAVATLATNSNGMAVFENLPINYTLAHDGDELYKTLTLSDIEYTLREITAAAGYERDQDDYDFTLTESDMNQSLTLRTAPKTAEFAFININIWNIPLSGGEFTLTDKTNGSTFTATATGASDGMVEFTGIPFGIYELIQTVTPDGHEPNGTKHTVTVSAGGVVTADLQDDEFINAFSGPGDITITLTDADTGLLLSGVTFKVTETGGFYNHTLVTNSSGELTFTGLMQDRSYIIEKTTPDNYYPCEPLSITVTAEELSQTILWLAYPWQGTITITVTDADTEEPIEGVELGIFDSEGNMLDTGESDEDGLVIFRGLQISMTANAAFDTPPVLADTQYTVKVLADVNGYEAFEDAVDLILSQAEPEAYGFIELIPLPVDAAPRPPGSSGFGIVPPPAVTEPPPPENPAPDNSPTEEQVIPEIPENPENTENPENPAIPDDSENIGSAGNTGSIGASESPEHNAPIGAVFESIQLPNGFYIIKDEDGRFIIIDDNGIPRGYIILPFDMTLDEFDILGNIMAFEDEGNPVTGTAFKAAALFSPFVVWKMRKRSKISKKHALK